MSEYFIQKILLKDVRYIQNFEIPISENERKHLLITGKNGSGKTTTLLEINKLFAKLLSNQFKDIENLEFSNQTEIYENILNGKFILAFFEAKRENKPILSNFVENIGLSKKYNTDTKTLHKDFIKYMVKLRLDKLDAKEYGEPEEFFKIEDWFNSFENALRELFDEPSLQLKYYRKEQNFKIEYDNKSFGLNELSDGYSSILAILTELILRMDAHRVNVYDMQGVVLVDEIETHLHVELQKRVLPFLTTFFPKIQFIVTTHSPFVLSSISNAIICDLEKRIVTEDLSSYSYDGLVENYFNIDKYSQVIKNKLNDYKELIKKDNLTEDEEDYLEELEEEFEKVPDGFAPEFVAEFQKLQLQRLTND